MGLMLFVLVGVNVGLLGVITIFAAEVLASLFARRRQDVVAERHSVAIIVPAHEEEDGIGDTVTALRARLHPGDRLIVVADNCRDGTAERARAAGAEVIERTDDLRRGKGYALDFGVRHLIEAPPDIVVFVDADCTLEAGAIDLLAIGAKASGRPVQGCYLMAAPEGSGINLRVAELAFLVKNRVRPLGLHRLGLPCHLTGSGMAFPWEVISKASLANGSLVEDMKLGLDLALAGSAPLYCAEARINSWFPHSQAGAASQRKRWEEGHLGMSGLALRYLGMALSRGKPGAVTLALDLLVPPLTLLLLLAGVMLVLTAAITLIFALPMSALWIAATSIAVLGLAVVLAWSVYGREALPPKAVLGVLPYILSKLGLYRGLARGARSASWVRTDRKGPDA